MSPKIRGLGGLLVDDRDQPENRQVRGNSKDVSAQYLASLGPAFGLGNTGLYSGRRHRLSVSDEGARSYRDAGPKGRVDLQSEVSAHSSVTHLTVSRRRVRGVAKISQPANSCSRCLLAREIEFDKKTIPW